MQSRLFKNPNFSSFLWIGKNLEKYTAPNQHFKIQMLNLWMGWKNVCPNVSFTVQNKIRNSHKRGWSHFKLNINDWDILFPKTLRIYQWIERNTLGWFKKYVHSKLLIFDLLPPCSSLFILHAGCWNEFSNEKLGSEKREKNYLFVNSTYKMTMLFTQIYMYTITTIKIFTCSYIKKSLKKCLRLFNKTFSNYQATY